MGVTPDGWEVSVKKVCFVLLYWIKVFIFFWIIIKLCNWLYLCRCMNTLYLHIFLSYGIGEIFKPKLIFFKFQNQARPLPFFSLLECMPGSFGQQCNNSCGHCFNQTACHHVTGTCAKGCEPGYQASNCIGGICFVWLRTIVSM